MRCLDKTKISSRFIKKAFKGSEKPFKVLLLQFRKLKKSKYIEAKQYYYTLAKGQYDKALFCPNIVQLLCAKNSNGYKR